ncbi:MAG: C25 family peptidase propeptide domain-containing protein, partial [candidate division WOR-3 bacterium]
MKVCLSLMTIGVFGLFGAWVPVGSVTAPTPPEVKVIRADETEAVLEINLYGFEVDRITARGVNYDLIRLPGEMTSQDVGKPEVPRIPRAICIPNEARVVATILESEKVVLKDYNLYPAQRPLTDLDIELPFEIDHIAYASDRLFPAQPVDIWNQGQWRDVYIANTDIYPIQFNPLRGELTVYTHLVIRYSYLGGKGYPEAVEPEFAAMYRSIMCNYDCLGIRVEKFLTPGVRYLVFCPTKYYNTARRLIDWHHKQGFKTKVIQATSFPTPQAIK